MAKVDRIIELLETRIARGDYALTAFPAEVRLADENGVSRMTARKAVLQLMADGLLERDEVGRLCVTRNRVSTRPLHIGFFSPMLNSSALRWRRAVEQVVHAHGGYVRCVPFHHWDDPMLLEAVDKFDGIFLGSPAEALPANIAERLQTGRAKVVITGANYSHLGLASIDLVPTISVATLLDYLGELGHRRIAAFNTQPMDLVIERRLEQWQSWLGANDCSGELRNHPEASYGEPMERAYAEAKIWLSSGELKDSAVFCLTLPAAIGLMRAMGEKSLVPGREISVCSANDEGLGRFLYPAVTSIQMPDPGPFLEECVQWMAGKEWTGPLFKRPQHAELFIGESTSPPISVADNNL